MPERAPYWFLVATEACGGGTSDLDSPRGFLENLTILLGNIACNFKKIPMLTQDLSRRCIATRGESVSTYPRRPKAEALT